MRLRWWFWRAQGRSFDDSVAKAVDGIKKSDPTFEPKLLPRGEARPLPT